MFGKKAETEVVEEVERELKFKEWFNLKGIRAEIKNVHWLTKKELFNNSVVVDPQITEKIADGIDEYLDRNNIASVKELIGGLIFN